MPHNEEQARKPFPYRKRPSIGEEPEPTPFRQVGFETTIKVPQPSSSNVKGLQDQVHRHGHATKSVMPPGFEPKIARGA